MVQEMENWIKGRGAQGVEEGGLCCSFWLGSCPKLAP